ncbi:hypothetical protein P7C71_g4256, partial [Lecanoromycetidae sp. Uapishka_2]
MNSTQQQQITHLSGEQKCFVIHKINHCRDFDQLVLELNAYFDLSVTVNTIIKFVNYCNQNDKFSFYEELAEHDVGYAKKPWYIERAPMGNYRPTMVLGTAYARVEVRAYLVANVQKAAGGSMEKLTDLYNHAFPDEQLATPQIHRRLTAIYQNHDLTFQLQKFATRYTWHPDFKPSGDAEFMKQHPGLAHDARKERLKKAKKRQQIMAGSAAAAAAQAELMRQSSPAVNVADTASPTIQKPTTKATSGDSKPKKTSKSTSKQVSKVAKKPAVGKAKLRSQFRGESEPPMSKGSYPKLSCFRGVSVPLLPTEEGQKEIHGAL